MKMWTLFQQDLSNQAKVSVCVNVHVYVCVCVCVCACVCVCMWCEHVCMCGIHNRKNVQSQVCTCVFHDNGHV